MRVELRPTITSDIAAVTSETLPIRIRAITAVAGERVLGIGGIGYRPDGVVIGFAFIGEEFRLYPTAIHRAGLAMMRVIREVGVPEVLAMADKTVPRAERWLERLGFKPCRCSGEQIYVWRAADVDVE
jgi:hypothetical protein